MSLVASIILLGNAQAAVTTSGNTLTLTATESAYVSDAPQEPVTASIQISERLITSAAYCSIQEPGNLLQGNGLYTYSGYLDLPAALLNAPAPLTSDILAFGETITEYYDPLRGFGGDTTYELELIMQFFNADGTPASIAIDDPVPEPRSVLLFAFSIPLLLFSRAKTARKWLVGHFDSSD